MMTRAHLWLLPLPRAQVLSGLDEARLARRAGDPRPTGELHGCFGLHPHERRVVRVLAERHPELWVFRPDQRRACGDLVIVDMSARLGARRCLVLELKQRAPLRDAPRHVQLINHPRAVSELTERGLLDVAAPIRAMIGEVTPQAIPLVLRA